MIVGDTDGTLDTDGNKVGIFDGASLDTYTGLVDSDGIVEGLYDGPKEGKREGLFTGTTKVGLDVHGDKDRAEGYIVGR